MTVKHMQHMPKALDHMHLPLHHVISDVTGVTGMRMLRAIVAGERDPQVLATYRDDRITSPQDPIAKALEGDDRSAHVCTLTQALALSDFTPQQLAACDQEIERVLGTFDSQVDLDAPPSPHQRRPIGNRSATHRPLICAAIGPGSPASTSRRGLASKP
jgi:hypothetical protein